MRFRILPVAVAAAAALAYPAFPQGRPAGPAELPPPGFVGQQYVDSRGCAFLRAGHGNQVNWVPRLGADRRPICGLTPTRRTMAEARAALDSAEAEVASARAATAPRRDPTPAPAASAPTAPAALGAGSAVAAVAAPRREPSLPPPPTVFGATADPLQTVAVTAPRAPALAAAPGRSMPSPAPEPTVFGASGAVAAPEASAATRPAGAGTAVAGYNLQGCPPDAPAGVPHDLRDGRRVIVCSRTGVTLGGLRSADVPVAARTAHVQRGQAVPHVREDPRQPTGGVPAGYRAAWLDDRLNPLRGPRSAHGDAQMHRVWTEEVPQRLHVDAAPAAQRRVAATVSSKGQTAPRGQPVAPRHQAAASAAPAAAMAVFVQVGSFAVADNATRAIGRLQAMGLPVSVARGVHSGKPMQVVRAGPFASEAAAVDALAAVRRAGFSDAILRRTR